MENKNPTPWEEVPILPEEESEPLIQDLSFGSDEVPSQESVYEEVPMVEPPEEEPKEGPVFQELSMEEEPAAAEEEAEVPSYVYPPEEEDAWLSGETSEEAPAPSEAPEAEVIDVPVVTLEEESEYEAEAEPESEPEAVLPQAVTTSEEPQETDPVLDEILTDPSLQPAPEARQVPEEESAQEEAPEEYRDNPPAEAAADKSRKKNKEADPRPTRKGRPKRKKGEGFFGIPNILATGVWLALILTIGVTLGRMLWVCAADVLAFGREDKRVTITIYEADSMDDVVNKLYDAGLIRYKGLFNLYASISDAEEEIKPGIYDLNTRFDYHALVNSMSPSSTREVIELTIPEGFTCRQIFALLEENRVCTAVDIAAYAADGLLSDYWFLEGVARGSEYCLEGFLFPDTYQFYKNSSPREALEKMLDNFEYRFSEEMRAQIDVLNANVTDGTYGIREVVIVASLIEKESASPAESPTIASVIYNRLFNWDYPALLNIDAAIVYAQGGDAEHIDTSIDSPYNTYRYTGLTPTPISNPGLASLKAALNPETTKYYYYVLNPSTGMHQFSTTQAEHDEWIAAFYN